MQKICDKLVQNILIDVQKESHELILLELRECVTSDPNLFKQVISSDETWFFQYDPKTK